jgi:DnaK suppressor protein
MEVDATLALQTELEAERSSLRAQLAELGYGTQGSSYDPNFADSSQVTAERGESEALVNSLAANLREVEHALAKIAEGTYGLCEGCANSINPERLEAMPAARCCIDCAAKRR